MPQNNPLAYLDPSGQIQAGANFLMEALMGAPAKPKFELDDMTLLDLRQRVKSPQAVADKFGVDVQQVYDTYPEFKPQGSAPAPASNKTAAAEPGFFEKLNAPRQQLIDALGGK